MPTTQITATDRPFRRRPRRLPIVCALIGALFVTLVACEPAPADPGPATTTTAPAGGGQPGPPGPAGPTGPAGPQGPVGPKGDPGAAAVSGVLSTQALSGPIGSILPLSSLYVFAGPTVSITTTATHRRVTGSVMTQLGLQPPSTKSFADMGLCSRSTAGGPVSNFTGASFSTSLLTTERRTYGAASTVQLAPGTYDVGFCVRNNGAFTINDNNVLNGFIQVTT